MTKIFVIGSLSQSKEIQEIAKSLKTENFIVKYAKPDNRPFNIVVKQTFDNIDNADVIIVLQKPDGTIGKGTAYEIEYAKRRHKKINFVNSYQKERNGDKI